jgi:hypothetical protein
MKIFEVVSVGNNIFYFSILEHIKANRRNIDVELKKHLKLCGWERSENLLSIENSKRTRHKLRKLIQKYTVSNMNSSFVHISPCLPIAMFGSLTSANCVGLEGLTEKGKQKQFFFRGETHGKHTQIHHVFCMAKVRAFISQMLSKMEDCL